jgi:glycosyltransferase involved in cell wall biosynthesis
MNYLIEAIEKIVSQHPEWKENTGVAILGGQASIFQEKLSLPVYPLGYVSDEKKIVDVYSSVDAFVIPSLEDNLPNTVMEALSCGVPCVGFKTGGIPEMIDHRKNGYIAEYRNSSDLADGIKWVIDEADRVSLSQNALRKVALSYSQHSVAMKYIEAYNQASAFKRYRI